MVRRVLLKAGATCPWNTTDEELLQVVDGAVRLRVGAEQQDVDDAWVAVAPAGSSCEASAGAAGASLLRVELAE